MQLKKPTVGPILGARIYLESTVQQPLLVRGREEWTDQSCFLHLYSDDGRENKVIKIPISTNARNDLIGKVTLKGLSFDTVYNYQIGILEGKHDLKTVKNATFKGGYKGAFSTSNPGSSVTRFVFGSCCHFSLLGVNQADDAAFKSITEHWYGSEIVKDDFIMMLGDQIYGDHYNKKGLVATLPILDKRKLTLKHYFSHYRKAFGKRYKRKLMASIPTYMTFDDHEVHNDWGSDRFLDKPEDYRVLKDALHVDSNLVGF